MAAASGKHVERAPVAEADVEHRTGGTDMCDARGQPPRLKRRSRSPGPRKRPLPGLYQSP